MIKGFDHVGITVKNLERSLEFYCGVLGFQQLGPIGDFADDQEEIKAMGMPEPNAYRCVLIRTPNGLIEMFDYKRNTHPNVVNLPADSVGKLHLAFTVDDVAAEVEKLKKHNIHFYGTPREDVLDDGKITWVYFSDPDGITLEFVQRG